MVLASVPAHGYQRRLDHPCRSKSSDPMVPDHGYYSVSSLAAASYVRHMERVELALGVMLPNGVAVAAHIHA